ncbi:MAG: radical SAM/SPASM domain-containing protein, partial [Nitrospinota bacterium]|nr:radical SAM/SPASM domain-containing protein [Nitrospinota bacterium]
IDPANACNFKCHFCPTGHDELLNEVNRPKGVMNFDLFCKIIDDASQFPDKIKSLILYKDGEPFLNKNLGKMIAYANQKEVAQSISTTTNASLITREKAVEILEAGLTHIRISVEHVSDKGYQEVTKIYSDYSTVRENVRFLFEEKERRGSDLQIHTKIIDIGFAQEEKKKFLEDFGHTCDSLNFDGLMGWSLSGLKDFTLETDPQVAMDGHTNVSSINVCPDPFYGVAINFDGTVSVCCVDWSHGTLVGDTKTESLTAIWNGKKMYDFRMLHLTGQRAAIEPCADCQYMKTHIPIKHIDDVAPSLVEKYQTKYSRLNG